jgi:oligopeptide/dipeptide ABC transporter ATP-binding protein
MDEILRIDDLRVTYREPERTVRAVDGVTLSLARGSTLALVGESGCGKTTVALATLDLVPEPGRIESGRILYEGRDVLTMKGEELRSVRGRQISIIFQDPVSGLNPVLTVGAQVEEMVRTHLRVSRDESRRMTAHSLRLQGLADAERVMGAYPYQLSGGMCQRVMIALATILRPPVIIADEPTSALDVTVQAGVLRQLHELKESIGASILLITHDFGVVAQLADDVAIMYAGRIVERADVHEIFARPQHPYTAALLDARPRLDQPARPLQPVRGAPPDLAALDDGCAFLSRCNKAVTACRTQPWPPLAPLEGDHEVACYNPVFQPERAVERR